MPKYYPYKIADHYLYFTAECIIEAMHTSLMTIALSVMVTNIFGTFKLAVEEIEKENGQAKKNSSYKPI